MNETTAPLTSRPIFTPAHRAGRALIYVIVFLACIVGGIVWWYAGLRNQFYPDNFGVVEPGRIYRSAQISRRVLPRTLADNHIQLIIDLSQEASPDATAEEQIAAEMHIPRLVIPGLSGKGIGDPNAYTAAIEAIVKANRDGKVVLVHCQSGAQRTGGVIAVYRMLLEGKSEAEAFAEAKQFHHRDSQNPHLVPFVEKHLAEWKAQLRAEHILPVK